MANNLLPVNSIVRTGLVVVLATSLSTNDTAQFANDGRVFLFIRYLGAGGAVTVSVATPATISGIALTPPMKTLTAAAAEKIAIFGPFEPEIFNNSTGLVTATFSIVGTTVNVYAMRL